MQQIRLINSTGSTSKIGRLVKVSPLRPTAFVYATHCDIGIIGTTAQSVPNGNPCLINLIGTVALNDVIGITVSATEPINPKIAYLYLH